MTAPVQSPQAGSDYGKALALLQWGSLDLTNEMRLIWKTAVIEFLQASTLPSTQSSPPQVRASQNTAERDPSVMPDSGGGETCDGGVNPGWDECQKCGATADEACAFSSTPLKTGDQ